MRRVLVTLMTVFAMSMSAHAAVIFSASGATINSGGPGSGSIADTYNQSGLLSGYIDGVTDFDVYMATNPMHSFVFAGNEWFGNQGTTSASVTYDFGSVRSVDAVALWNEESSGIGILDLFWSVNNVDFFSLSSGITPTDNPLADYSADVFSFTSVDAQYIRFDMNRCPQDDPGSYASCAIGEVAFREGVTSAVPEPATWLMMILGFGMIGVATRRRKSLALA
ncbi:hypothetical protein GCM10017044_12080 [Kordiimonas sediminis]|uniref:Ice-binding protein C-terminal domain-containing protein n=1 Tax=Kordiimonas sediminis TaxID=1735581 RepID=A0A919AQV8_9PROT|nr:PEPxxWA-CTERM sorting domain-containing protein [Kordiimonas sediminis]GHF19114.1 hypothetical protein GCM10017044_12080 [Kordiimonas sediminis]